MLHFIARVSLEEVRSSTLVCLQSIVAVT